MAPRPADIEIRIGPDGDVTVDVRGVKGPGCVDLTRFLEEALGDVTERTFTQEYRQRETEQLSQIRRRV